MRVCISLARVMREWMNPLACSCTVDLVCALALMSALASRAAAMAAADCRSRGMLPGGALSPLALRLRGRPGPRLCSGPLSPAPVAPGSLSPGAAGSTQSHCMITPLRLRAKPLLRTGCCLHRTAGPTACTQQTTDSHYVCPWDVVPLRLACRLCHSLWSVQTAPQSTTTDQDLAGAPAPVPQGVHLAAHAFSHSQLVAGGIILPTLVAAHSISYLFESIWRFGHTAAQLCPRAGSAERCTQQITVSQEDWLSGGALILALRRAM